MSIERLKKFGFLTRIKGRQNATDFEKNEVDKAAEVQQQLLELFKKVASDIQVVLFDPDSTVAGKSKKLKAIKDGIAGEVAKLTGKVSESIGARIAEQLPRISLKPLDPTNYIGGLRQREIRDRLAIKSESEIRQLFLDAINRGDEEVYRAIIESPVSIPVRPKILAEGKQMWAAKTCPDAAQMIQYYQSVQDAFGQSVSDVVDSISAECLQHMTSEDKLGIEHHQAAQSEFSDKAIHDRVEKAAEVTRQRHEQQHEQEQEQEQA